MLIAKDEIFGPVMSLMKFKTIDEAIKVANNTRYGLAAGIVTKNLDVGNTLSRSIRAGIVWINCYFAFDNGCPYGGYKMSGFGRDLGLEALHKYVQVKSVVTPIFTILLGYNKSMVEYGVRSGELLQPYPTCSGTRQITIYM